MMALSENMRKTLEALHPYDGALHGGGATAAEVEASGGTRRCLGLAVDKGWVTVYEPNRYAAESGRAKLHFRSPSGTKALEEG